MDVLIAANGYPTESCSVGIFEFDQAKALAAAGCRVAYASIDLRSLRRRRKWGVYSFEEGGVAVYALSLPVGPLPLPLLSRLYVRAMGFLLGRVFRERGRPDLVHAHFTNLGYAGARLKDFIGRPLILTEHSSLVNQPEIGPALAKMAGVAYRGADALVAVSPALAGAIERRFGIRPRCIPNIVDSVFIYRPRDSEGRLLGSEHGVGWLGKDQFNDQSGQCELNNMPGSEPGVGRFENNQPGSSEPNIKGSGQEQYQHDRLPNGRGSSGRPDGERFGDERSRGDRLQDKRPENGRFRGERFRFVSTGSLIADKGMLTLVEAFGKACGGRPGVSLVIFGEGEQRGEIEQLINRQGLGGQVALKGQRSRSEIAREFGSSDCFVLASRSETFGVAYTEALAAGLPVIATRCGGPESFVHEGNGLLVAVDDTEALAGAMRRMLDGGNSYRREEIAAEAGRLFSPAAVAAELIRLYREILRDYPEGAPGGVLR